LFLRQPIGDGINKMAACARRGLEIELRRTRKNLIERELEAEDFFSPKLKKIHLRSG
jgi:hypothetical protein